MARFGPGFNLRLGVGSFYAQPVLTVRSGSHKRNTVGNGRLNSDEKKLAHPGWGALSVTLVLFVGAALSTVGISASPLTLGDFVLSVPFGLGLLAAVGVAFARGAAQGERLVLTGLWSAVLLLSIANIVFKLSPILVYGDGNILLLLLERAIVPAKWLAGYELLDILYAGIWKAPSLGSWVTEHIGGVDAFAMLASTCAAAGGAIVVLRRWGDQLPVRLAALTPFLLVLGAGYREYYPFIICLYLGTVCFALEKPLKERPPWLLGAVVGLLPAVYIGFLLWALILGAACLIAKPRKARITLVSAASTFLLTVRFFWPGSFREFFEDYYANLRLVDRIPFQRYEVHVSESRSIFFDPGYVLTPEHLADLRYAAFYTGLFFALLLGAVGLAALIPRARTGRPTWLRDPRFWLSLALVGQQAHYFGFMVPHFGPRHDIDVYFSVPVIAMLFAGVVWRHVLSSAPAAARRAFSIIVFPLLLGHGAALSAILLFGGLPNVYRGMDHTIEVPPEGRVIQESELLKSLDGASVVNDDEPELFLYATFFTTAAAEINFEGEQPQRFEVTQHYAQANARTRAEIWLNGQMAATWGGRPRAAERNSVTFDVTLNPGLNRLAYKLAPVTDTGTEASAHLGRLVLRPK